MTTAMPSTVAKPEISISHRTLATIRACAGSKRLFVIAIEGCSWRSGVRTRVAIEDADAGDRLDRVLAARTTLSRSRLKALILDGEVTIGTRTIRDPSYRVNAGDNDFRRHAAARAAPSRRPRTSRSTSYSRTTRSSSSTSRPGSWCIPAAGHGSGTLVNALIAHCGDSLSGIGGVKRPGIVHRLDKDTTGLMVVAKTDRAHQALAAQFADHGRTGPLQARLPRIRLGRAGAAERHHQRADRAAIPKAAIGWRCARTAVPRSRIGRCLSAIRDPTASRWQVCSPAGSKPAAPIRSGFTSPMSAIPCWAMRSMAAASRPKQGQLSPAAQDALAALGRQALHAYLLAIEHPVSRELLEFRSELPSDFARLRMLLAGRRTGPALG